MFHIQLELATANRLSLGKNAKPVDRLSTERHVLPRYSFVVCHQLDSALTAVDLCRIPSGTQTEIRGSEPVDKVSLRLIRQIHFQDGLDTQG